MAGEQSGTRFLTRRKCPEKPWDETPRAEPARFGPKCSIKGRFGETTPVEALLDRRAHWKRRNFSGMLVSMSDVTHILSEIEQGDPTAAEQLLPLVYAELRKLAAAKLAQEKPGQTLQATALVHEAYLRLLGGENATNWKGRGHFFGAASEAMRRILVERARRKQSAKHGGDQRRVDFGKVERELAEQGQEDLVALDEALGQLEGKDPRKAQLVKLKYFVGLTNVQVAEVLGVSPSTVDSDWAYARCWLRLQMSGAPTEP